MPASSPQGDSGPPPRRNPHRPLRGASPHPVHRHRRRHRERLLVQQSRQSSGEGRETLAAHPVVDLDAVVLVGRGTHVTTPALRFCLRGACARLHRRWKTAVVACSKACFSATCPTRPWPISASSSAAALIRTWTGSPGSRFAGAAAERWSSTARRSPCPAHPKRSWCNGGRHDGLGPPGPGRVGVDFVPVVPLFAIA